jgi:hypothetical protein
MRLGKNESPAPTRAFDVRGERLEQA